MMVVMPDGPLKDTYAKMPDWMKNPILNQVWKIADKILREAGIFVRYMNPADIPGEMKKQLTWAKIKGPLNDVDLSELLNFENDPIVVYISTLRGSEKLFPGRLVYYSYFLHAAGFVVELGTLVFGSFLPKSLKWLLKVIFSTNALGFIVTNGVALWKGAISPPAETNEKKAKYYYMFPAVYFIVLLLQVLTNFLLIGPLKLISWVTNPIFNLLNLINLFFITVLPLYHAVSFDDVIAALKSGFNDSKTAFNSGKELVEAHITDPTGSS
jgi:hypothetical protein